MNENFTNTELLIRYIDRELSAAEESELKNSLQNSPALQQEYDQLLLSRDAVKSLGLKNQISAIHNEMMQELLSAPKTKAPVVSLYKWSMRMAAALFLVALSSAIYLYFTVSGIGIYDSKYSEYTVSNTRSAETGSPIVNAYKAKDYTKLIELSKFFKSSNPEILFLTGMAYLQTNQTEEAIKSFESLLEQKEQGFKEDAEYYLALAYIRSNNYKAAIPIFKKINQDKLHPYNSKISSWDIRKLDLVQWKQ